MKKIIKSILISFLFFGTSTLFAQNNEDIVYLRNGSILKGTITTNNEEKVSIKTSDGREYIFNKSEVEKTTQGGNTSVNTSIPETKNDKPFVTNNVATKTRYTPPAKGFWFSGELQLLSPLSLNVVAGYKLHRFAYLGLGTGIHNYTEINITDSRPFTGTIIPIYVRYSGDIVNRRTTPFYSIEGGYGFAVTSGPLFQNIDVNFTNLGYTGRNLKSKGGAYGALTFGFKVRTNKNISFGAGFTYRIQQSSASETGISGYDSSGNPNYTEYTYKYLNQRFGLKLIFVGFN
jgi:hypothetical protein